MQQNLNFGLKSSSSSILLLLFSSDIWLISLSVGRGFELIETRSPSCCELRIDADEMKNISFSYGERFEKLFRIQSNRLLMGSMDSNTCQCSSLIVSFDVGFCYGYTNIRCISFLIFLFLLRHYPK